MNTPSPLHYLGGAIVLWGCEKAAPIEAGPKAVATAHQEMIRTGETANPSPEHKAWLHFIDQIEKGQLIDYSGQYVAKGTTVDASATKRVVRPKYDAASLDFSKHFVFRNSSSKNGGVEGEVSSIICNNEDCTGGPGGGGVPGVYSTFTSSENRGGSGNIHDIKISTSGVELYTNYVKLGADLNKGAGGLYIDLVFTRNNTDVISGREYYNGNANSSPSDIVTMFSTKLGSWYGDLPSPANHYFHLWRPTQSAGNPFLDAYTAWGYQDLNEGAGGEYIYGYQSKSDEIPNFVAQFHEIGILSGNSASINPPAGWLRDGRDLNQGAGGDYIYFCYKY